MSFNFNFPVRIFSGIGCVKANKEYFRLGKHAFIVCGRSGARLSGALGDVESVLADLGIEVGMIVEVSGPVSGGSSCSYPLEDAPFKGVVVSVQRSL